MSGYSNSSDASAGSNSLILLEEEDGVAELPIKMKGWLRKRSGGKLRQQTSWNDRYFVLRGNRLEAFLRRADLKPKNMYVLNSQCQISEIYLSEKKRTIQTASASNEGIEVEYSSSSRKANKGEKETLYCCKITWFSSNNLCSSSNTCGGGGKMEKVEEEDSCAQRKKEPSERRPLTNEANDIVTSNADMTPYDHRRQSSADMTKPDSALKRRSSFRVKKRTQSLPSTAFEPSNTYTTPKRSGTLSPVHSPPRSDQDHKEESVAETDEIVPVCGITKHYSQRLELQNALNNQHSDLLMRQIFLTSKLEQQKKTKKAIVRGSKYAAVGAAAVTAGVLTAGIGLGIAMVFVGVTAAAGGGGAMAEATYRRSRKSRSLILASKNLDEMKEWRAILARCIMDLNDSEDDTGHSAPDAARSSSTWAKMFVRDGRKLSAATRIGGAGDSMVDSMLKIPNLDRKGQESSTRSLQVLNDALCSGCHTSTRWRPLEGGWATLLGTGAHGLRMFREENPFTAQVPNKLIRRSNVRVEGNHGAPLKAHIILNSSPLETFMCLMSHARSDSDFSDGKGGNHTNKTSSYANDINFPLLPNSGQRASFRVIETLDDHMDIIHLYFRPMYLFPTWTAPRDFVLFRYWRFDEDGSYVVFYDSIQHRECPPVPGYTRGELHCIYTIAPAKQSKNNLNTFESQDCMLTQVVQVDPKGWIPTIPIFPFTDQSFSEAFSVSALMQMLDVRDALDHDRFVSVSTGRKTPAWKDAASRIASGCKNDILLSSNGTSFLSRLDEQISSDESKSAHRLTEDGSIDFDEIHSLHQIDSVDEDLELEELNHYDSRFSVSEFRPESPSQVSEESKLIFSEPAPLNTKMWAEPDANSFRVRSRLYKSNKKKQNAGQPMMRLIAVDLIESDATLYSGVCAHPKERVQQALAREEKARAKGLRCDAPPFIFCLNIALAGPPYIHMVFFFAIDDTSKINGTDGTPSSKLFHQFLNGDDEFRKNTFKLIPSIVEGNFIVRKAVGCTPCIMGKAIRQLVIKHDRYLEVILDTGSSSVAAGVIKLCYGYAKTLVVDLAFLFEGNDETVLPEKVIGCVRLKNVDFKDRRFVHSDPDYDE